VGWHVKQSWTLLAPDGSSNIIVSCEPLSSAIDLATYAGIQGDLLRREFPGYVEHGIREIVTPQGPVPLRMFDWRPPDGVPVRQHQMYFVEDDLFAPDADGAPRRLGFTATGTAPVTAAERHQDTWFDVLVGTVLGHRAWALRD
jgi:hypothetical protein